MFTKLMLPALAAFLTVLSLSARESSSAADECHFKQTIKRFKARVPSDAFRSIGNRGARSSVGHRPMFGRASSLSVETLIRIYDFSCCAR
jgi:hypothetical protein